MRSKRSIAISSPSATTTASAAGPRTTGRRAAKNAPGRRSRSIAPRRARRRSWRPPGPLKAVPDVRLSEHGVHELVVAGDLVRRDGLRRDAQDRLDAGSAFDARMFAGETAELALEGERRAREAGAEGRAEFVRRFAGHVQAAEHVRVVPI